MFKVTNTATQKFVVKTTAGTTVSTVEYSLAQLFLEEPPAPPQTATITFTPPVPFTPVEGNLPVTYQNNVTIVSEGNGGYITGDIYYVPAWINNGDYHEAGGYLAVNYTVTGVDNITQINIPTVNATFTNLSGTTGTLLIPINVVDGVVQTQALQVLAYDSNYQLAIERSYDTDALVAATQNWGSNHFVPATAVTLTANSEGTYDGPDSASVKPGQYITKCSTSGETTNKTGCAGELRAAIGNVDGIYWLGLQLSNDIITGVDSIEYHVKNFQGTDLTTGTVPTTQKLAVPLRTTDSVYPIGAVTEVVLNFIDSGNTTVGTLRLITYLN